MGFLGFYFSRRGYIKEQLTHKETYRFLTDEEYGGFGAPVCSKSIEPIITEVERNISLDI